MEGMRFVRGNDLTVGMICSRVYEIEGKQFEGGVVPWPVCPVSDCYNSPLFCVIGRGATTFSKLGVQFLGLCYCTEQNTDGIPSVVHCSLLRT